MIAIVLVEYDIPIRLWIKRPEPCNLTTTTPLVINRVPNPVDLVKKTNPCLRRRARHHPPRFWNAPSSISSGLRRPCDDLREPRTLIDEGGVDHEDATERVVRVRPARAQPAHAAVGAADKCVRSNLRDPTSELCMPLTESQNVCR